MNNLILKTILLSLLVFLFSNVFSQTKTVLVTMNNGEEYKGVIVEKDKDVLLLKTVNGEIKLIASNVRSIEDYNYDGKFAFENPHDTRYFFGPSGIPIGKGEGYYQNILVVGNFVNYGITKNISIGGGLEFISTVNGRPIWFITPKVGFEISKNINIGGGIIMAGFAAEGSISLAYGVFTLGHSETNLTLGLGYGLVDGELSKYPAIMISGTYRVSNSIALLTENYVFPNSVGDTFYFGIHGIRILSKKNSFDIGAIIVPQLIEFVPALPYVGYVRVF